MATELITGTVNGDCFYDFLRGTLIPLMLPFNGINSHSVLIMDNCAVHHASKVRQLVQSAGIVSLFLPPYSPDLNPIEEAFSNVKKYLRKHDELLQANRSLKQPLIQLLRNSALLGYLTLGIWNTDKYTTHTHSFIIIMHSLQQ